MNREGLITTLKLLRDRRESLIGAYCNEDHDLYIHMFLLPHDSPEMELAISKYFLEWLNTHSIMPSKELRPSAFNGYSSEFIDYYISAYKKLCENFLAGKAALKGERSDVLLDFIKDKIDNLSLLLEIGMRHEEKLSKLRYMGTKERNLFNRKFNSLKESGHGNS